MNESERYATIARAIEWLRTQPDPAPNLSAAAATVGLSPFHFQRLFVEWVGVSPKEFCQSLAHARAKQLLADRSVLSTTYDLGLSSPARLHDLFVTVAGLTPGEAKRDGAGVQLAWAFASTPFGEALFAATERGLCHLAFADDQAQALAELTLAWPRAQLREDPDLLAPYVNELQARMRGAAPRERLGLLLRGSSLRLQVWQALLKLPAGAVVSYSELAHAVGKPRAVRAVASCVAENPLGWLIPCHRVIRADGDLGQYHWGSTRKLALIAFEYTQTRPAVMA